MNNDQNGHQSHIQIPKFILKRFVNPKGFFAYYDIKKKKLGTNGTPKSMNTAHDYYSIIGEQYWHDEIETEFSKLLAFLDSIDTDQPKSLLPVSFDSLSKKYLYSLMA